MLEETTCCSNDEAINLSSVNNLKAELLKHIQALTPGDKTFFSMNKDFSADLIAVVNENFQGLPLRAKFMEEGPKNWVIKVKLPKVNEGCCGGGCG